MESYQLEDKEYSEDIIGKSILDKSDGMMHNKNMILDFIKEVNEKAKKKLKKKQMIRKVEE